MVLLAGCAPSLAGGNSAGGVIRHVTTFTVVQPLKIATDECAKYGKVAVMKSQNLWNDTERYECVAK